MDYDPNNRTGDFFRPERAQRAAPTEGSEATGPRRVIQTRPEAAQEEEKEGRVCGFRRLKKAVSPCGPTASEVNGDLPRERVPSF